MKRRRLGMRPRATRAAVIGYPNVGKSSLINRLLGRKLAKSRNIPGFTKTIQWIRIGGMMGSIGDESPKDSLELLDTPGIIPPRLHDQEAATALAICNDIGQAAYSASSVAAAFFDKAKEVYRLRKGYVSLSRIERRYKLPIHELSGEDALSDLADSMFEGNLDLAGEKVLADFRKGYLGPITLELPPDILDRNRKNEEEESRVENEEENFGNEDIDEEQSEESETDEQEDGMKNQLEQSRSTIATGNESADRKSNTVKEDFVERSDKGKFDGW
eukprot:CAMPEP_0185036352 /NCGR_PEP_ID=MMETSP1103-20130426/29207_1 /TAXON_ID=36769 /ORGANISM="Paraphysomonas bandaiensis, Strain Caron Lab Isolate" /LENGTH=273 /DNA_ID=CAMNT_0027573863 /DNA_START=368 /DNA_END=1189 /DNA_ORIENTATION=+